VDWTLWLAQRQFLQLERVLNIFRTVHLTAFLGSALSCFSMGAFAQAQTQSMPTPQADNQVSSEAGWHVGITPYIWFAGVNGDSGILGHEAGVHASFGDIFNYLNIGAMGDVDVRYNRVIIPVDVLWMKLSDNKALPLDDPEAESIKAKMNETVLTPKIGYRVGDGRRVKVDALFGARYWHLGTTLTLQPVQLANGFSRSANWADAVAGGRIEFALSRKASATIFGDAGGGSARLDYQVGGFLGYKLSRRWTLLGGYRYLSVDYRPNSRALFVYDVDMPGLAIGATFNVK
jgi:hypothetical protein